MIVTVIGSGTMGGGIAAHFANAGIPVHLLDVTEEIAAASKKRLEKSKPAAFFTTETASLVTTGATEGHDDWIAEADWIVEAIVEDLGAKRALVEKLDRLRKPDAIVTSNTSGLPIAQISANASEGFKKHFLGTHFFNPPRYMKLLEIIPTPSTDPAIVDFVREFAEHRLGKGVVLCKDTPNFIANRLGSVSGAMLVDFALEHGYTIEETDAIAGPLIGRPKTAAFRLQDLVGLDVASSVAENLYGLIEGDESREVLRSPRAEALRKNQMERGRLGDKTGQGFYKKDGKTILTLDLDTGEYRPRREPEIPSLAAAAKIRSLPERLAFILAQDDKAGAMARHVIYNTLGYAARRVPEITDDFANVDRAMRWGFSHEVGPFELWDALGVRKTADAMREYGLDVPKWVDERERFYPEGGPVTSYLEDKPIVRENKGAALRDLGDGVLCLEFRSKMNTLDDDVRTMIVESVEELERGPWRGMVIGNEGVDFCVGANLKTLGGASIDAAVKAMQDAFTRVRFAAKPIVAAPFGRTLGGGVEISLAAARIVAHAEAYMGLPELSIGLIPGAGGCKELVRRIVSPVMRRTPNADPLPQLQSIMQTVGMAKVSTSAAEARSFGFLGASDRIVMNRDHLIAEAKEEVLAMAHDYAAPAQDTCYAAGRDVYAAIRAGIYVLQQGGYMSEYDAHLSSRLAWVLTGGELSSGEWVGEQFFLDRERAVFAELAAEPKTQQRIQAMLETGKPLRN